MIAHVKGRITHKSPESVILDVGGIGYEIHIPLSTYCRLPDVEEFISLTTYTHVREDMLQLYGFFTQKEKGMFQLLISVSGVGPRLARNILSGIPADDLASAVSTGDAARLKAVPGVGGKTAERLILELRDKMAAIAETRSLETGARSDNGIFRDVYSALVNLGYKGAMADRTIERLKTTAENAPFEALLKEALKILAKG